MEKTKKRDMNFELLRIISMLLIIASHYILYSGILDELETFTFNYVFLDIIRALTRISVNLYVLITGYYMIKSKIKVKKAVNLWVITVFYSVLMLGISILVGLKPGVKDIIKSFVPVSSGIYWFVTAYLGLYVLTPFINKLLRELSKKQYQILILILFFLIVVVKTVFNHNKWFEPTNGSSIVWLIYLYMIGAYIRLHFNKKVNKKICFIVPIIIAVIIAGIRVVSIKILGKGMERVFDSVNIFNFISTICCFFYFKEVKIKKEFLSNIIVKIAPTTFAVYLIHNNPIFRPFMFEKLMGDFSYANSPLLIIHFIVSVVGIFLACAVIDLVRQKVFDKIGKLKLFQKIDGKLDKVNEKFWNIMEAKNENQ